MTDYAGVVGPATGLSTIDDAGRMVPDVTGAEPQTEEVQYQPDTSLSQPRVVPQEDLDALRSKLESRAARAENEARQYQQRVQQLEYQTNVTARADQYYAQYMQEIPPELYQQGYETQLDDYARKAQASAEYYAKEDYQQDLESQSIVNDAKQFRNQKALQTRQAQLDRHYVKLVTKTGLSAQEIATATAHLDPRSRTFEADSWEAVSDAVIARGGQGLPPQNSAAARQIRQTMPMPGSGGAGSASGFTRRHTLKELRSMDRSILTQARNEEEMRQSN